MPPPPPLTSSVTPAAAKRTRSAPSWNICVARMKVLARVSQLSLSLEAVSLTPALLERLQQRPHIARGGGGGGGNRRSCPPTFFVRFALPGATEEISLCSRRLLPANQVEFRQRKVVPVVFNSKVNLPALYSPHRRFISSTFVVILCITRMNANNKYQFNPLPLPYRYRLDMYRRYPT
jgi:hypothetical protein